MSRTNRKVPANPQGLRHPKTQRERRQLKTLKTDAQLNQLHISPPNRLNKHIPEYYDDLVASATYQLDYNS